MFTATYLKSQTNPANADQKLYEIHKEGAINHYVIVSAVVVSYSGPETYIFLSDGNGKVLDWMELPGSFQGDLHHTHALNGYLDHLNGVLSS